MSVSLLSPVRKLLVCGAIAAIGVTTVLAPPASAGAGSAQTEVECREGGNIHVTITDGGDEFDIRLDDVLTQYSDVLAGTYTIGPLADGNYNVKVINVDQQSAPVILNTDVNVDCGDLPSSGSNSDGMFVVGAVLTLAGFGLFTLRRRVRYS